MPELLPEHLLLLLKRLHLGTRRAFDEALVAYGLTGPQVEILRQVWQCAGLEQRALQDRLGVTSATLTGIIDGLVERELAERRLSPDDARVKQLFLTPQGQAVGAELAGIMQAVEDRLVQGFTAAEQALMRDWLSRMVQNLGTCNGDGNC
jgi:DNA-binding MarR family transcriptional regulator